MKTICIVEFPSNLGLRAPAPGKEPGVKQLPDWLRKYSLHQLLAPVAVERLEAPLYNPVADKESGYLNADALVVYAKQQAVVINKIMEQDQFPFVLGGDCSILLGPAIALKQQGNFGLFYLDGHTDFMDITFSQSGGIGGMAASVVTGNGHKKLVDILSLAPYIKENNLWCVGNREYDAAYENEIQKSAATYVSLAALRQKGIANCVQHFLQEVADKKLDGFWLHIDVDVLNDAVMPCVDSRTEDGMTYAEFNQLTYGLFTSDLLTGVEITILDPDLDETGQYTAAFVSELATTFKKAMFAGKIN